VCGGGRGGAAGGGGGGWGGGGGGCLGGSALGCWFPIIRSRGGHGGSRRRRLPVPSAGRQTRGVRGPGSGRHTGRQATARGGGGRLPAEANSRRRSNGREARPPKQAGRRPARYPRHGRHGAGGASGHALTPTCRCGAPVAVETRWQYEQEEAVETRWRGLLRLRKRPLGAAATRRRRRGPW